MVSDRVHSQFSSASETSVTGVSAVLHPANRSIRIRARHIDRDQSDESGNNELNRLHSKVLCQAPVEEIPAETMGAHRFQRLSRGNSIDARRFHAFPAARAQYQLNPRRDGFRSALPRRYARDIYQSVPDSFIDVQKLKQAKLILIASSANSAHSSSIKRLERDPAQHEWMGRTTLVSIPHENTTNLLRRLLRVGRILSRLCLGEKIVGNERCRRCGSREPEPKSARMPKLPSPSFLQEPFIEKSNLPRNF